jgi:hypothetical protein
MTSETTRTKERRSCFGDFDPPAMYIEYDPRGCVSCPDYANGSCQEKTKEFRLRK